MKKLFDFKAVFVCLGSFSVLLSGAGLAGGADCNSIESMLSEGIPYKCESVMAQKTALQKGECVDLEVMLSEGSPYGCEKGQGIKASGAVASATLEDFFVEGFSYSGRGQAMLVSLRETALEAKPGAGQAD